VGTRAVGASFFWSSVYYLSKLYELLDTFILILKKRLLTFLHAFHHATVIVMCCLWRQFVQSLEIITLLTNTIVHVIMYSYYFLCSINHPPPWKKVVTNLQNVQFLFSFIASIATFWLHFKGGGMVEDDPVRMLGFSMLSSTSLCYSFSSISIASNMEPKTKAVGAAATVTSKHDFTLLAAPLFCFVWMVL
jgi:hypothetical protein